MSKSTLNWYKTKARRIMRDVSALQRKDIGKEINESGQLVGYRIRNVYQRQLEDWIRILNMAGYEIVEKEGE